MGPVNMGTVADIGWPDTSVGTFGVMGQVGDVTGTLGKSGRDGGSTATGPGIVRRAPGADDPEIIGQAFGVGDPGDDQVGDGSRRYACDPNSGAEGLGIFGQTSVLRDPGNGGVGDELRRYICDSNDGDGLRSYTCNPNNGVNGAGIPGMIAKWTGQTTGVGEVLVTGISGKIIQPGSVTGLTSSETVNNVGDGPGRYTSGPNDGDRPRRYKCGHNDDKSTGVQAVGRRDV